MPKWVYPLSFVVLLYIIFQDPSGAGRLGAGFIGVLGEIATAAGEFIGAVFGNEGTNQTVSDGTLTAGESGATLPGTVIYSDAHGTLHTHQ